jgi:hypothetical protein
LSEKYIEGSIQKQKLVLGEQGSTSRR